MFQTIVMIIVGVLIFYVAYRIIKSIMKAMIIAFLIMLFITAIFGLIMYTDVKDIRENFWSDEKLIILKDDELIMATTVSSLGTNRTGDIILTVMPETEFNELKESYPDTNYSKVHVVNKDYFDLLPQEFEFEELDTIIETKTLKELLVSPDPLEGYISMYYEADEMNLARENLLVRFNTPEDFRAALFILSNLEIMEQDDIAGVFKQYRKGNLEVYPKSPMFSVADLLPGWLMSIMLFFLF